MKQWNETKYLCVGRENDFGKWNNRLTCYEYKYPALDVNNSGRAEREIYWGSENNGGNKYETMVKNYIHIYNVLFNLWSSMVEKAICSATGLLRERSKYKVSWIGKLQ